MNRTHILLTIRSFGCAACEKLEILGFLVRLKIGGVTLHPVSEIMPVFSLSIVINVALTVFTELY